MSLAFGFALPHWQPLSGGFSPASLFAGGTAGAWYDPSDLSTLFTTSAGTTPVAMPGLGSAVSVGLMLDKSQGLVLGSEATSGAWLNTYTTTFDTFSSTGPNSFTATTTGAKTPRTRVDLSIPAAGWYVVQMTATFSGGSFTTSGPAASGSPYSPSIGVSMPTLSGAPFTTYFYATGPFASFVLNWNASGASTLSVTGISVRELPGNHAISFNNTTARPELRARVNLLTYSEEFDNAAWTKTNAAVTANTVVAPDGTLTADGLVEDATTNNHVVQLGSLGLASGTYVASMYVRPKDGRNYCLFYIVGFNGGQYFELTGNGNVLGTQGASPTAPSIAPVANGFYRIQFTFTGTATNFQIYTSDNGTRFNGFAGNGSTGLYLWGADLRPANIGANVPAYQRIADANTYDTSGFPLYLFFDGIDDSMYTPANLNLSGTDKVAVFAGVRKLSDAAVGVISELSSSAGSGSNPGTFILHTQTSPVGYRYAAGSGASGAAFATDDVSTFTSPISNVITGTSDFAGATIANEIGVRVNGVVPTQSIAGTVSTGNFGTYPLFIGARNNANLWLNGPLYSLIIAGSAVSAGNISATEQWVAGKTGIQI